MRRLAKVVNFGILYGISGFGLAQAAGIGRARRVAALSRHAGAGGVKAGARKEGAMPAYFVVDLDIHDAAGSEECVRVVSRVIEKYGGRYPR